MRGAYLNRYARSGREYEETTRGELLEISKDLSIYDIDVIFDPENARLICKQNVKLVSRDDIEFNSIYFPSLSECI